MTFDRGNVKVTDINDDSLLVVLYQLRFHGYFSEVSIKQHTDSSKQTGVVGHLALDQSCNIFMT